MKSKSQLLRKALSVSLAAAMLCSAGAIIPAVGQDVPGTGIVANAATEEQYFDTSDNGDGTVTITGISNELTQAVIPSTIGGKTVTGISGYGSNNLTKITFPATVTTVGNSVFWRCDSLQEVVFEGGLKSIGECAFQNCTSLSKVTLPSCVEKIGAKAFSNCPSLVEFNIPESVKSIGAQAFEGCSALESVVIPDGVKTIDTAAFDSCTSLSSVTLSKNLTTINDWAFNGCSGIRSIDLPQSLSTIGEAAFVGCTSIKKVYIPRTVTSLGKAAIGLVDYHFGEPVEGFTMYCVKGSDAEKYCDNPNNQFGAKKVLNYELIDVSLNKTAEKVLVGKDADMTATVSPADEFIDKTVTWKSSNTSVATVDENGRVKTLKPGKATITASSKYDGAFAEYKLDVRTEPKSIKLAKGSVTLLQGKTQTVNASLTDSDAYDTLTWTSSDKSVATVDSNGKITAKKAGNTTITAKTINGKTATCKVTVNVDPTNVKLNKKSATLEKGKTLTLKATVSPSKFVSSTKVTWSSSSKKVATVDSKGKITAKGAGTATITAKTVNGKKAIFKLTVNTKPTSVKLSKKSATLKKGKSVTLEATVSPSKYVTSKKVTWSTSNKKVATVKNGKVTAKKAGTVTITAKTVNGKTAKCKITVKK